MEKKTHIRIETLVKENGDPREEEWRRRPM
jgi:hypothetical protein